MVVMKINSKTAKILQARVIFLFKIILILASINIAPIINIVYAPVDTKVEDIPIKVLVMMKWLRPIRPKGNAKRIRPRIARFFMIL